MRRTTTLISDGLTITKEAYKWGTPTSLGENVLWMHKYSTVIDGEEYEWAHYEEFTDDNLGRPKKNYDDRAIRAFKNV